MLPATPGMGGEMNRTAMAMLKRILLKILLEDAMSREEMAYRFYETARDLLTAPEAVALVNRLMAGELSHRIKLEDLQKQGRLPPGVLSEEIALEYDQEEPNLSSEIPPDSSSHDILHLALQKERQAAAYYTRLARYTPVKTAKEVFAFLSQEEHRHVEWIAHQLAQDDQTQTEKDPEVF
ncbi:hypothetical protein GF339_22925 [candidate division KSB3 bacterium]|uniref:Rubrerythrin diiron-binding domain-containing protein n=1 Tax=candidate division KSB3 bacterium TaxID=2044937 RepID=A0A9D5K069_9BACT|nr:hypothetical protein [candidate division KSB3 bacterium]MBD3327458.1 hypothetical protein [candidate division KSB3 bacterium]